MIKEPLIKETKLQHLRAAGLFFLALFLTACTTTNGGANRPQASVEDRVIINGEVLPLPDEPSIEVKPLPGQASSSPVVRNLLATSEQHRSAGKIDSAVSSLERALRIEPRNAMLWSRLADIRYAQQDFTQAIQLAAKSNTLTGTDIRLRRQNWYLMANAHAALGNDEAAQNFRDKLQQQ